eukprot:gene16386-1156_t
MPPAPGRVFADSARQQFTDALLRPVNGGNGLLRRYHGNRDAWSLLHTGVYDVPVIIDSWSGNATGVAFGSQHYQYLCATQGS